MNLNQMEVGSILFAVVWLTIGILVLWYANRLSEQKKPLGKAVSFWGLSLLINAAIAVYIPNLKIAGMLSGSIFIIGLLIIIIYMKKYSAK